MCLLYIVKHDTTRYLFINMKNTLHEQNMIIKLIWIPTIMRGDEVPLRGDDARADRGMYRDVSGDGAGFWGAGWF